MKDASEKPSVAEFYDALAPSYHLIFEDWDASIARQGAALDSVIRAALGDGRRSILDVACGIGTQSLGLAARGHDVTGSDASPGAIERARVEAARRGLAIELSVADMRRAHDHHRREFDAVVCADNALPHLLSDEEISAALAQLLRCTRPGGLLVLSVRDYAAIERGGVRFEPFGVRRDATGRWVLMQLWEWRGALYDFTFYFVRDEGRDQCRAHVVRSTYYAITTAELLQLMEGAGFADVRRIDGVFFQPLLVGTRPD